MLKEKELLDKLYDLPERFRVHMGNKDYPRAKSCYDTARTIAVFMELDEERQKELFGVRGERGVILRTGLFPEASVQKAYRECIKSNQTRLQLLCQQST
ncbi:MAG: hypothetical protein K2K46_01475 [Lachnospiraceae bacterium]|nr:hypothetical protein [Lachnospiraceae bacterium]